MSARIDHPALSDGPARSNALHGAQQTDSDIKELLERVDEEHRRLLATVTQRISQLELESHRARAMGERARQVVADAEAEAAEIVQAAREEGDRLRADAIKEVQERTVILLENAQKDREALLATSAAEAERKRAEAEVSAESLLDAARANAEHLAKEAQQYAVPAPELRVLVEQMGQAFQQLSGAISAMASEQPEAAGSAPAVLPDPLPPPEASLPLIGSRGEQSPTSPEPGDEVAGDGTLRPFRARPTRSWDEGSRRAGRDGEGSNGARRGWRFRDN